MKTFHPPAAVSNPEEQAMQRILGGSWLGKLHERLPLLGHRNWIAVVDAAYPWQNSPGVETIATGADHFHVLTSVLHATQKASHLRPQLYLDQELERLTDKSMTGFGKFKKQLSAVIDLYPATRLPHEEIIARLDLVSQTFAVLIFKTTLLLPYTSVFVELQCGYWDDARERTLRAAQAKN